MNVATLFIAPEVLVIKFVGFWGLKHGCGTLVTVALTN